MIIVDSSAVIAILFEEADAPRLTGRLFDRSGEALMSVANYVECGIVAVTRQGRANLGAKMVDTLIDRLGLTLVPVNVEQARLAVEAYARYGRGSRHPAKLNYGDTFAYALAKAHGAPLLYVGDDFVHTDIEPALP